MFWKKLVHNFCVVHLLLLLSSPISGSTVAETRLCASFTFFIASSISLRESSLLFAFGFVIDCVE